MPIAPATIPIRGISTTSTTRLISDRRDRRREPLARLPEVVRARREERTHAAEEDVGRERPQDALRVGVARAQQQVDDRPGPDEQRGKQRRVADDQETGCEREGADVGPMLVVARHARRDADRDGPGGVVHEDRQPERRLEEPDRGGRLEGADQQRVELVEEQVRALDDREHARVGGDLPRSALRRPDRKRTAAEQLRDHDGADHDRGAVADGARKRRSGRAGAGRDQRDRRDQEHDALRDRHRDDRSDPRLRDQDGAVELHHRAGDEGERDPAQRPGQARLRVEVGDRPGREDEDHADEPRDQHLQPQRVGDVVGDRAPVAAPLGDEASDRRTDPEVHHERERAPRWRARACRRRSRAGRAPGSGRA